MNAMSEITIDKGVPIPTKRRSVPKRQTKYKFADMEVGDSFAMPLGDEIKNGSYLSTLRLTSAATSFKTRNKGWAFSIRTLPEKGEVRIWRVA